MKTVYVVKGGNNKYFKKYKLLSSLLRVLGEDIYADAVWVDKYYEAKTFKSKVIADTMAKIYNGCAYSVIENNKDIIELEDYD